MKRTGLFNVLLLLPVLLHAQEGEGSVYVATFEQLETRLQRQSDTTYVVNFRVPGAPPAGRKFLT